MADVTGIEWADSTFNGWIGCTKVGPGCDHCYAEARMDTRLKVVGWGAGQPRKLTSNKNWGLPKKWNEEPFEQCADCGWRGAVHPTHNFCPNCGEENMQPARRRVFCSSLSDVFDNEVSVEWRVRLFDMIRKTPNLDWLLLTKRVGKVRAMINGALNATNDIELREWLALWVAQSPPANVWLGATVVNQAEADRDIQKLLNVPARVRFLSMEPLLGSVNLTSVQHFKMLDWVIVGGESGPGSRPMHPHWVSDLRDQCYTAGVPFLFKQWGDWCPRGPSSFGHLIVDGVPRIRLTDTGENGQELESDGDSDCWMNRAGKKAAGRMLFGRFHTEYPKVKS